MSFLFIDTADILNTRLDEISSIRGVIKLLQFWKYHLHLTMGRPIIMRWKSKSSQLTNNKEGIEK